MFKRLLLIMALLGWALLLPARAADPAHETTNTAAGAAAALESDPHAAHDDHAGPPKALLPDASKRETQLQALWVVIIFIVLLMILYPTAWRNVLAGLKKREERIRKDIADAEAARAKAEATLKEYNAQLATAEAKVRDMLATAHADAEKLAASIRMRAQTESEEIKERATRDIEASKNQAIREVYEQTAVIATSIAEKILRRNLNADDQRDLVNRSLEQVQTIGR